MRNAGNFYRGQQVALGRKGTVLDRFNEVLVDCTLHPTKGYRRTTLRRLHASVIVDLVKAGKGSPFPPPAPIKEPTTNA